MLCRAWADLLAEIGISFHCPTLDELDLTRPATIQTALGEGYRLVINAAAYTDVDRCEQEEELAKAVNGTGVGVLAAVCARTDAFLIHYSTDYVFDGLASEPYDTESPRCPINAYGRTKAFGEQLVEASGCRFLIIRTSWLYAPWGRNFVRTMAQSMTEKSPICVVDDQRGRPTSARHLAEASWQLAGKGATGVYHVTDNGDCTWYDFAMAIADIVGAGCTIRACSTAQHPRPATRPAYSVLDLSKTTELLGALPHWTENLRTVLALVEEN